ncbi:ABC transporter ATP-binding protein [Bacillus sp. DX4.1]|uniref:ABC transporter ATP-binding protein n=1 Tax=Bacillus sp. DX4.1 TaxID=3055867 RepID=UPI0025A11B79|nr:ABC transporter ATP-binding protein [Bacillus sp. DX4.1]MDM5189444.1 ABC transporter ATP-binding protein [Bacillus sp. DX4.1]
MTSIETKSLTLAYDDKTIINELSLVIPPKEITVFVGSNGCGKSTLLRSVARLLKPKAGEVILDGKAISKMATKDVAQELAILPQGPEAPEGLTILQLVKQGRYPYQSFFKKWTNEDETAVKRALEATGLYDIKHQKVDELSGGQRQRAWIAMTLAQETDVILLDEPTTYLDLTHQIEVLDLLFKLNEKEQRTIVMVLHDLNLTCRYAHHVIALKDKQVYAEGRPENVVTEAFVKDVFHVDSMIIKDPIFGTPLCVPKGTGRKI